MYDVVIIGGGPGGSTLGALLKKYRPNYKVLIVEKTRFPRDHVGESLLPHAAKILHEMDCWNKIEAADFPIKIGATLLWGKDDTLWDFDFLSWGKFETIPRPAPYEGQRVQTAFQVDRAKFDTILLDHAKSLGCEVRYEANVVDVIHEDDRVQGIKLSNDAIIHARYYVDASGNAAVLRRKLNVPVSTPLSLENIAIWDYWDNADWATKIGVGGTRILLLSLSYGWLWFIPISRTRTSIGLVTAADYYKQSGLSKEALYEKALQEQPLIKDLIQNATSEGNLNATTDWSFLAERHYGENWFLVGESAGFADPILSAGVTITMRSAFELAHTIPALDDGKLDPSLLKYHFQHLQIKRIEQHINFANYWYVANAQASDLKAFTADIAHAAGLDLSANEAFRWLATGGFTEEHLGTLAVGGYDISGTIGLTRQLSEDPYKPRMNEFNMYKLNLKGAHLKSLPYYVNGEIHLYKCYTRANKKLINLGNTALLIERLQEEQHIQDIVFSLHQYIIKNNLVEHRVQIMRDVITALELYIEEGWVTGRLDKSRVIVNYIYPEESAFMHANRDNLSDTPHK